MNQGDGEAWRYSPDPTIGRIWRAREALEAQAEGDVRRLFALATRISDEALRALVTPEDSG
jgi:hypothetical protein